MNKALSTILKPLQKMEEIGIVKSYKKANTRYFSLTKKIDPRMLLESDMIQGYAGSSHKLRTSHFLMSQFTDLLTRKFADFKHKTNVIIQTPVGRDSFDLVVGDAAIGINRISNEQNVRRAMYNMIGRVTMLRETHRLPFNRVIFVLLLPPTSTFETESQFNRAFEVLKSKKPQVSLVMKAVNDFDLVNDTLVDNIVEQVKQLIS